MNKLLSLVFGLLLSLNMLGQKNLMIENPKYFCPSKWDTLYRIKAHPEFDTKLTPDEEHEILIEINHRRSSLGDSLQTADLFYIWKPYFEWLKNQDPHYNIIIQMSPKFQEINTLKELEERFSENALMLPFNLYNINDTLVVRNSNTSLFQRGDAILSINGINTKELLKYNFSSRYTDPTMLLNFYYYKGHNAPYNVELIRGGRDTLISYNGINQIYAQYGILDKKEHSDLVREFSDIGIGYIKIPEFFPNNSRLIRDLKKSISKFKNKGVEKIIIDIRNNPGGSGHKLSEFLSLFINKKSICISSSEYVKVSTHTMNDWNFITQDMQGQLLEIPKDKHNTEVKLIPKKYIPGVQFYILMDQGTASIAAAICNILDYHSDVILVGEPLLRNAYRYGDVVDGCKSPIGIGLMREVGISTTASDLYTNAIDGILTPDIHIPYRADKYMAGNDDILETLIDIIK